MVLGLVLAETEDTVGLRVKLSSLVSKGKQGIMSPLQNLSDWSLQAGSSQIINEPGKRELQVLTGCQWALNRGWWKQELLERHVKELILFCFNFFLKNYFHPG